MKSPKYRHYSAASAFFVLVLCCMLGFASGKNSLLSQLGNIMTETSKGDGKNIDYDAATGTVLNAAAKVDSSCDGQLAAALVQAKELASNTQKDLDEELAKHKAALETIVDLQKGLALTNSELVEERDDKIKLKEAMTESLQIEKSRSENELRALKDTAGKELKALRDEKDIIIASLKEDSAKSLDLLKSSADKNLLELKVEKDDTISSLEAKLKMSSEELQETMRMELEKAKQEKEVKVAQIAADRDAVAATLTERLKNVEEDSADLLRKTQEDASTKLAAVEADRDTQLATLKHDMAEAAKEAKDILHTAKEEAKTSLLKQVESAKQQAEKTTTEYEQQLSEKNKKMKNLEVYIEKIMIASADSERALNESNMEITHWRKLHAQRSYCNMTYIATDFYDASAVAYRKTSDAAGAVYVESLTRASAHVSDGLEYSNAFLNEKFNEHWPTISPYYDEHISGNYHTHLEPHLQKYVFPKLRRASSWSNEVAKPLVLEAVKDGKEVYNAQVLPNIERQHQGIARMYGSYCRSSLQEFLKASQELEVLKDHPPPAFLLESWETSCANPEDSMNALIYGSSVLLLVLFHRRIIGLASSILVFILFFFIRLTPLRFVISRGSAAKKNLSPPSSPSPPSMKEASTDSLVRGDGHDEDENNDTNGDVTAALY